jgi:hypothetical protein
MLLCNVGYSQQWKRNKYRFEVGLSSGVTNFLGELGGANRIGTNGLRDLEMRLTRPSAGIDLRYLTSYRTSVKVNLIWGRVLGDDKLTTEPFRRNRNLNFRSDIVEFSAQFEFNFFREKQGHRYKIKKVKGMKQVDNRIYLFAGVGGFYFNPKGKYANGAYYNLRPLRTEGQGIVPGSKMYSNFNVCIPIGIGGKYALDRQWSMGFEIGMRKTFTDYIDDVSSVYRTQAVDTTLNNPLATYFANPTVGELSPIVTADGQQRGDATDNDAYMFISISINYKIMYKMKKTRTKF